MPNYCTNILDIHGEDEDIEKFLNAIRNPHTNHYNILHNLLPTPTELTQTVAGWSSDPDTQAEYQRKFDENLAKYGYKDWYDWNVANWGTKWSDDQTHIITQSETHCSLGFTTAWCPPEKAFNKIALMFPKLMFVLSYYEDGMGFVGASAYHGERSASAYTEEISYTPDEDGEVDYDELSETYENIREACAAQVRKELFYEV